MVVGQCIVADSREEESPIAGASGKSRLGGLGNSHCPEGTGGQIGRPFRFGGEGEFELPSRPPRTSPPLPARDRRQHEVIQNVPQPQRQTDLSIRNRANERAALVDR